MSPLLQPTDHYAAVVQTGVIGTRRSGRTYLDFIIYAMGRILDPVILKNLADIRKRMDGGSFEERDAKDVERILGYRIFNLRHEREEFLACASNYNFLADATLLSRQHDATIVNNFHQAVLYDGPKVPGFLPERIVDEIKESGSAILIEAVERRVREDSAMLLAMQCQATDDRQHGQNGRPRL